MSKLKLYDTARTICDRLARRAFGQKLAEYEKIKFTTLSQQNELNGAPAEIVCQISDPITAIIRDATDDLYPLVVCPTKSQACGAWDSGKSGFEETLAYCTTLSLSLRDELYPVERDELIYHPNVWVFRDARGTAIKSFQCSVATVHPMSRADFSIDNDRAKFSAAFHAIFRLAISRGHSSVIFNAIACDDDNNPADIAQLMNSAFADYRASIKRLTVTFEPALNNPLLNTFKRYLY